MKRSHIKAWNPERTKQLRLERILLGELMLEQDFACKLCGGAADWRGFSKHEFIKRSQGGNPLAKNNCIAICGKCHSKEHGIREV